MQNKYSVGAEMNRWGTESATVHFNLYNGRNQMRNITNPTEILNISKAEESRLWNSIMPLCYGLAEQVLQEEYDQ